MEIKERLKQDGADLTGVASIDRFDQALPGCKPTDILPEARAVLAFAVRIPRGSFETRNSRLLTNSWNMANAELARIAFSAVRDLEDLGYLAVAIPPFLPIDMLQRHGLVGDLSLKHAAAMAGMGMIGLSGLLLTPQFGPRQRLGAVITNAPLQADSLFEMDWCDRCREKPCIRACPVGAIGLKRRFDKLLCLDQYQKFGGRSFVRFLRKLIEAPGAEQKIEFLKFPSVLEFYELHQFIRVGGVACVECMRSCPIGK